MLFFDLITDNGIVSGNKMEVSQEDLAVCTEENILWFDIAVNDVMFMGIIKSLSYL